jgi:hypothetical protein
MKNILKPSLLGLLSLALCAAGAVSARAQVPAKDARVLVARAGVVNFVSGAAELNHEGETAWRALTDRDEVKSGDVVRTGGGGRAEVLLNPGSYFRLGELSQFEMADSSLDNLRLKLVRGSAIVEAAGYDGLDLDIVIETPQTRVRVVRTGIYRVNVLPSGVTEVAVWKGRALVGEKDEVVKEGRVARVGAGGDILVAKFDKKMRDAFDMWSRERGKELAKLNEQLGRNSRQVSASLASYDFSNDLFGGIWVRYGNCYVFVPYSGAWSSPYGGRYGAWYDNCGQCRSRGGGVVVTGGRGYGGGYGGGNGSGGGYTGGGGSGSGGGGGGGSNSGGGSGSSGGGATVVNNPPEYTPPSRGNDSAQPSRGIEDRPSGPTREATPLPRP